MKTILVCFSAGCVGALANIIMAWQIGELEDLGSGPHITHRDPFSILSTYRHRRSTVLISFKNREQAAGTFKLSNVET